MAVYEYDSQNDELKRIAGGTLYADLPIGFILPSFESIAPQGFLKMTDTLANRTVSRTTYKELFDWATERGLIGTGKPFGDGDGSTTFVIPDGKEIAFKGIGEYEGTVGNHVKSGGLAVGEFIDDRFQNVTGSFRVKNAVMGTTPTGAFTYARGSDNYTIDGSSQQTQETIFNFNTGEVARTGATTEVKSVGCHYYIKAKNVGVPADFVSAIDDVIGDKLSYSTTETNTGKKWINGKDIYRKVVEIPFTAGVPVSVTISGVTLSDFQVIDMGHSFIYSSDYGTRQPWGANGNSDVAVFYMSSGTIYFTTTHLDGTFYAVVEYTKSS